VSTADSSGKSADALSTQTTLQNVEVYRVGDNELGQPAASAPAQNGGAATSTTANTGARSIGLLVNHQDAVTIKFVKDSGGTIDLVTRSKDDQQVGPTNGVTLDSLTDRFRFRVPQPVVRPNTPTQSA
jgi:hypothetical protein